MIVISCGLQRPEFTYKRAGSVIELVGEFPSDSAVEIHIRSHRNRSISRLSDRADRETRPVLAFEAEKEIWFPVVDVEIDQDMDVVAIFDEVSPFDLLCWNGNFAKNPVLLKERNVFTSNIEHWENSIFVKSATAELRDFVIRKSFSDPSRERSGFRCLTENWAGTVKLLQKEGLSLSELATIEIEPLEADLQPSNAPGSFIDLIGAIRVNLDFLLRSRNRNVASPTFGGLYLFYDLSDTTYRRSDWIWTWGPAIRFLIDASALPEITAHYGREDLLTVALEMGEASLRFLVCDQESPAHGLMITRFDPTTRYPCGHSAFASPADAFFLAGWGYVPLYESTGESRFLETSRLLVGQTDRLLNQDAVIEQDFVVGSGKWKNWTMDESGFGMEAFAELYRITKDPKYQEAGRRYLASLTRVLERDDGLWDRTWHRQDPAREDDSWPIPGPEGVPVRVPTNANTRGLAWAMMGLLAAHRLLPDEGYLDAASQMASHLLEAQSADGHWNFLYDRSEAEVGISEKGTAIWSLLLYRLYRETRDPAHLEAARRALQWCLGNRYHALDDPLAQGGIVGQSPASGVVYRRWFPLICTYTMSFYGNALIAELQVRQEGSLDQRRTSWSTTFADR
jgi:hypothetical protein